MKYIPSYAVENHMRIRIPCEDVVTMMNNFLKFASYAAPPQTGGFHTWKRAPSDV